MARPVLPVLYLFMGAITIVILGLVFFANQHLPCWYDEICMLDPAYHRATTGIWHSIAQWDSLETIPFAPNYPLHINFLRFAISLFGTKCWLLRGSIFFLGLAPVVILLWIIWKKGVLLSWQEVLCATYLSACCTFFYWSVYVRPEAILLCAITLFVITWTSDRPVFLFLSSIFIPLCGLQWNVLLLAVFLHWLVFGGRFRKLLLVTLAFGLSSAGTIVAYHLLGMWPSYLQEAARVGGLDALHAVQTKLLGAWSAGDFYWLFFPLSTFVVLPCLSFAVLGLIAWKKMPLQSRANFSFAISALVLIVLAVALLGHLNENYTYLIPLPICLVFPIVLRPFLPRHCLIPVLLVLTVPLVSAHGYWERLSDTHRNVQWLRFTHPDFSQTRWLDESSLETAIGSTLSENDVVLAPPDVYFALRLFRIGMYPHEWAFDLSNTQQKTITAVLLDAAPSTMELSQLYKIRNKMNVPDLFNHLLPNPEPADPTFSFSVAPEDILSALGMYWSCCFTELPFHDSSNENAIKYRLFRTSFCPAFSDGFSPASSSNNRTKQI